MTDVELVCEVESAAYRAWPAREVVEYDGWQLRFADGFSRRGNSVYPAESSTLPLATKLDWCSDWYRTRGQPLIVRQTPASEAGLDQVLAEAGFAAEGRTLVMTGALEDHNEPVEDLPGAPGAAWRKAAAHLWQITPHRLGAWRSIIERIDHPAAFIHRSDSAGPMAAGLAVAVDDWLGLFEIVVRPDRRRDGIGRDLTRSLLRWGRAAGAQTAFLQVVNENAPAIALYESLGFGPQYTYWYRRAPA